MAKRCQASFVSPAGTGVSQMPSASAKTMPCLMQGAASPISGAVIGRARQPARAARTDAHPPLEARGSPAHALPSSAVSRYCHWNSYSPVAPA